MKCALILAAFLLSATAAPTNDEHVSGVNGWYVPRPDGTVQWMTTAQAEKLLQDMQMKQARLTLTPVNFYLYTKANPTKPQEITGTFNSIANSNFNAANPTRIVIHGWTQSYESSMNDDIRDAWLSKGNFNVIIVDWARARSVDYASSVLAVGASGEKVAALIDYLHQNHGMSLETLDVIGHSLGAHVAGYAGKNVKSGRIHTIVGLDPALPLFSYEKPNQRLNSDDGTYVESIQTDGGLLGFLKPIGKGAFYPNGGKSQPGCGLDITGACSHERSVLYYAEAVAKNDFPSIKCQTYEDAVSKKCGNTYSSVRMGATSNAYMVAGDFYVPVNSKVPYGMSA